MFLPLSLASIGLLSSICGIGIVRMRSGSAPEAALRAGTLLAPVIFVAMAWFLVSDRVKLFAYRVFDKSAEPLLSRPPRA